MADWQSENRQIGTPAFHIVNEIWGSLMALIGMLMIIGGATKTEFIVYKLLRARAAMLWKEKADLFLMVSGAVIAVLGILFALGIIWTA